MAALVMASCSKNETLDINEGRGIGFRAMSNAGTRATEVTNNSLTDFWVTALYDNGKTYFSNVKFSGTNGGDYNSTPSYNWPAGTLLFHAIYPQESELDGALTLTNEAQKLVGFTVKRDISAQQDLVYAQATGSKGENEESGVPLKFEHMLSQISVEVKSDNAAYEYKVTGVVIGKIPSNGNLTDMKTKTWDPVVTKKITYEDNCTEFTMDGTYRSVMNTSNGNAMLIPQTLTKWNVAEDKDNSTNEGAYIGVKIQINTKDGGNRVYPRREGMDYAYACMPIDTKWEAGKHYVYKLDFSNGAGYVDPEIPVDPEKPTDPDQPGDEILGGPIKFTVDVTPWQPEGGQEIPVTME